ncbi:MAG: hypothetical protein V2A76_11645 [Planctomycetota bacterium]
MRIVILLCLAVTGGCASCPDGPDLATPERTIRTFQRAFACDMREIEFRCLSDGAKAGFSHLAGYSIGRDVFRQQRQMDVLLMKMDLADLSERTSVSYDEDGNTAIARIDTGEGEVEVLLVNEPEYRLFHPDGTITHEFANRVSARFGPRNQVVVLIGDEDLGDVERKPIQRVEIRPRWVIAGLPGLPEAQEASQQRNAP